MDAIIDQIKSRKKAYRIFLLLIALILNAAVYNIFLLPINLVTGGSPGIATITKYVYNIEPSVMIFLISFACIILSFMYLGIERTSATILASFIYPLFVQLTKPLGELFVINTNDLFIVIIFAGVLTGISNGLMYKTKYSNGGFPVVSQILYKYFRVPIAKSSLIINMTIVLIGAIFFGTTNTMYAIIFLFINSIVLNKILLGVSTNKAFYIITSEENEIKDYVINRLGHNVTTFDVKGGFLEKKRKVLLVVIPTSEYYRVTEGIKILDKDAFFVVTDAYEVVGGK